jgi:copper homeostasis protein
MMAVAARAGVPVHALIRPRGGSFLYAPDEIAVMVCDIRQARRSGVQGVVIGAARADGRLDQDALAQLVAASDGMAVTLNRVFDLVPDRDEAMDLAIAMGIGRILTSGGAATAAGGAAEIGRLERRAAGRIGILPAGGIGADNVASLLAGAPVAEVHASCSRPAPATGPLTQLGFADPGDRQTDRDAVAALKAALRRVS